MFNLKAALKARDTAKQMAEACAKELHQRYPHKVNRAKVNVQIYEDDRTHMLKVDVMLYHDKKLMAQHTIRVTPDGITHTTPMQLSNNLIQQLESK